MEYGEFVKNYENIDQQSKDLNCIVLEGTQNSDYYRRAYEIIKNYSKNINIAIKGKEGTATKNEFLRSEEFIEKIIEEIDPEWTTKQKSAYVHYEMGRIVSYAPEFGLWGVVPGCDQAKNLRNIYKAIDSGKTGCNGIATIERNILSRLGIKTKELSSKTHSFVLIETEEGNIISDATWDLSNTLFEGRPMYFGKTYEQLQQIDGPLSKAHRLEDVPENVIEVSEEELREIYHSIGITKDDKKFKFPILDRVNEINSQQFGSDSEKVSAFLRMFTTEFSTQATHLSETKTMIERCMPALGIEAKDITTKFIYSKEDTEYENPHLCMHINLEQMQDNILILNTDEMQFEGIDIKKFDEIYNQHILYKTDPFWKKYLQREESVNQMEQGREEK